MLKINFGENDAVYTVCIKDFRDLFYLFNTTIYVYLALYTQVGTFKIYMYKNNIIYFLYQSENAKNKNKNENKEKHNPTVTLP